jgi:hypothetical protein
MDASTPRKLTETILNQAPLNTYVSVSFLGVDASIFGAYWWIGGHPVFFKRNLDILLSV